ncbi:hypothetical protein FPHYL_3231 [Fusarium phyllophilum]|uniref:Uncharacterized protein n=1 Tax=Fusarium phyllophilum TaxID=47803 RepID=A0A8H5NK35_9HYPO|nr:hypothetical protein FPHYL_3231 [Fusarium phyllophilum]
MNYQSEKKALAEVDMLLDNQTEPVGTHNRRFRSATMKALAGASLLVIFLAAVSFGHLLATRSVNAAPECAAVDDPIPLSTSADDTTLHANWRVTIFDDQSCRSGHMWNRAHYDVLNCIPVPPSLRGLKYQRLDWHPASDNELFKLCTYSATGCPQNRLIAATRRSVRCDTAGFHAKSMKVVKWDKSCN